MRSPDFSGGPTDNGIGAAMLRWVETFVADRRIRYTPRLAHVIHPVPFYNLSLLDALNDDGLDSIAAGSTDGTPSLRPDRGDIWSQ